MKIILSRKGFDSASGGRPSPIFPDSEFLSLPIRDDASEITYDEIAGNKWARVGEFIAQWKNDWPPTCRAHLDPDLAFSAIPRADGWRPIFGQCGQAESHLKNKCVGEGDIFIYFGLFQRVEKRNSSWVYVRGSTPIHAIFGWLQIGKRTPVSEWPNEHKWALYHPHFKRTDRRNLLYIATDRLSFQGKTFNGVAGAGVFRRLSPELTLTAPDEARPGHWELPGWFHPQGRASALSYHGKQSLWQRNSKGVLLSSAGRGQEFVLDCDHYPEAIGWAQGLFARGN